MKTLKVFTAIFILSNFAPITSQAKQISVSSLSELIEFANEDGNEITMEPGTYSVRDYLTPERLALVGADIDRSQKRPPMPVLILSGSNNKLNLEGVILEIDTQIYDNLPNFGYHRLFFISGHNNRLNGLTMQYVGPNQGSHGNALTIWGDNNVLTDMSLYVHGSSPYGYGDLLGKGGGALVRLRKQSGLMIGGDNCHLKRCKVISRAFGHCFYIQGAHNTVLEDCYAEGTNRATSDMLAEMNGKAKELGFKSVYENREGDFMITPGYRKSLTEDGFRTYSSGGPRNQKTGKTTFINCTAINTRAGFEIVGPSDEYEKTTLTGCTALGTERGFLLIHGNIITRKCRGDIKHGPLLYLWRGKNADIELEVVGEISKYSVHALATISGDDHTVSLTRWDAYGPNLNLPIMLGYGMPSHAEMASPILPEKTNNIQLNNQTSCTVIESPLSESSHILN